MNNRERLIDIGENQENKEKPYTEGFTKPYQGNEREDCTICSDNDAFTYKSWIKLGCDHYFHRHCIDLWLEQRSTCPLCTLNVNRSYRQDIIGRSNIQFKLVLGYVVLLFFSILFYFLSKT